MVINMTDAERAAYINRLRVENAERQAELDREIAQREAFSGPEPLPWHQRFRRKAKQAAPDCGCHEPTTLRQSLTDAELHQHIEATVDARIAAWLAQEREAQQVERESVLAGIGEAAQELIDEAMERWHDKISHRIEVSDKARQIELTALEQTIAELRRLVASDSATVIEQPRSPRRAN